MLKGGNLSMQGGKIMKRTYETPIIVANHNLAEGVYLASGQKIWKSGCVVFWYYGINGTEAARGSHRSHGRELMEPFLFRLHLMIQSMM